MSWSRFARHTKWYPIFPGLWTNDDAGSDIPTDQIALPSLVGRTMKEAAGAMYLAQATNVFSPGISRIIRKRPGFTEVRGTAINAAGIFTSLIHQGEMADRMLMTVSIAAGSHNIYVDDANPPSAVAGGTNFTIGADNLIDALLFSDGTNPGAIFLSRLRDLPQFVNNSGTRSNFTIAGTGLTSLKPSFGEVFAQRALYGDVNFDGTVYDDRVYWSDIRDGNLISDPTTQFLSFETRLKDRVRGIRKISDICMIGKLNNIFTMVPTPNASEPFMVQEEPGGRNKGPVSHHAMLEIDGKLFWLGQSNIHSLSQDFSINDWADPIQTTIRGLNDARREFSISAVDSDRALIFFNVSNSAQSTNDLTIALNYKTGALYLWTLRRNALGYRDVSGQQRIIGGGYVGKFYNEMTGTAGNLDDATAVYDADVWTPRLWVNGYQTKQKIPFVLLSVDPIGTEQLTVQYRLDDDTSWSDPTGSPYTVSGTDDSIMCVPIQAVARRIQLRIRNNRADEIYLVKSIGIPAMPLQPAIN